MKSRPMISFVIATYNREKFLPDCLESLAQQTADRSDYEVVIVDNNSTDGTEEICRRFIDRHPDLDVSYYKEGKQGLSHARNRGIAEANGDLISFIDDDGIAEEGFAEELLRFFRQHPEATAVGGKIIPRFESGPPAWNNPYSSQVFFAHYDRGDDLFEYRGKGYPFGCNMTIRKAFFSAYGDFDTHLGRKGKGGLGGEEKALFERMHDHGKRYF